MPYAKREFRCVQCSNMFHSKHFIPDPPKYCSCKCRGMASRTGTVAADGYRRVRHNGKQVLEQRVVMEQVLGRPLVKPEHIHWRDGDTLNNIPGNLILCSRTDCAVSHRTYSRTSLEDRFWPKVHKTDGCWLWGANRDTDGYGTMFTHKNGRESTIRASHVSWSIHHSPVPDGMFVLHKCDNPPCVNPDHLFLGTVQDNSDDMVRKGRAASGLRHCAYTKPETRARGERHGSKTKPERIARGERAGHVKLTEDAVIAIRKIMDSNPPRGTAKMLAVAYGVSTAKISQVAKRQCWKHIP